MIPRYQRILFWVLSAAIILMALFMLRGCEQAREKLTRGRDQPPLTAPVATPVEKIRLALADDGTGKIAIVEREMALPAEPTARARTLLTRLIAEYSYKNSRHLLESGPAIDDVFLLDLPLRQPAGAASDNRRLPHASEPAAQQNAAPKSSPVAGGQLAVINLNGEFADHHPSGIEPEMLTIQSIISTLYANFPRVVEVRFLVDDRPRETLNGHVDLTRTYPAVDTSTGSSQENQ